MVPVPSLPTGTQVVRQPPGTYTAQGHTLRVAPLFVEPLVAWLLHALAGTGLRVLARRDAARLSSLQGNLRKMVSALKARLPWGTRHVLTMSLADGL